MYKDTLRPMLLQCSQAQSYFDVLVLKCCWKYCEMVAHHEVNLAASASIVMNDILSGPLKRLNAILSLLRLLDCYRTPSAIGSAIGRPYLAISRVHTQVAFPDCLILSRVGSSTVR